MKVVLFCGGLGSRLREHSETVPKPLVDIGPRPIIWHLMRYYAHFGHKEFILCLGYKGDMLKDYFLNYDDCRSNDFTIDGPERKIEVMHKDIDDWKITFVDTGMHSNLGMRLRAVQQYLTGEEMFLANYSDGLSDPTRCPCYQNGATRKQRTDLVAHPPPPVCGLIISMRTCGRRRTRVLDNFPVRSYSNRSGENQRQNPS